MSAHRELVNARQDLLDHVERLVRQADSPALVPLKSSFDRYDEARRQLDEAGAANRRHTSIAASRADLPLKGSVRRRIIEAVTAQHSSFGVGMTDEEIERRLRKPHHTVSAARNHLMERGWLRDSGERHPTSNQRDAIRWAPTDLALQVMREISLEDER